SEGLAGQSIRARLAASGGGCLVRRLRIGRGELPHQRGVVADCPVLGAFPGSEADEVHLLVGEAAAGGWKAEEVTSVPPAVGAVDHGGIALGENPVDGPA